MYLRVGEHKEVIHHIPIDLDAVKLISNCIWADDETGKYCIYDKDKNGKHIFLTDDLGREILGDNHQLKTSVKKGRIRFINTKKERS